MFQRLHRLDRIILLVGVPLWLVCFTLSLRSSLQAGASSLRVSAWTEADAYPEVTGMAPHVAWDAVDIRFGDRLIQLDGSDLRGVWGPRFFVRFARAGWRQPQVPFLVERDGRRFEVSIPTLLLSIFLPVLAITPLFLAFGIAIVLKAPRSPVARATFHLFVAVAFFFCGLYAGPGWVPWLGVVACTAAALAVGPLLARVLLIFPDGVRPRSPWLRSLPVPFVAVGVSVLATTLGVPYSGRHAEPIMASVQGLSLLAALTLLQRGYRSTSPIGRRQLKWCIFGLYLACLPPLVGGVWLLIRPQDWYGMTFFSAFLGLVPPFVYLALYRYDVFDVDRLITATATYNVVLVALAGAWLFLAPEIGRFGATRLGLPAGVSQLGASLALAVLVVPAQRRLRPALERLLFEGRRTLERELAALRDELAAAENGEALLRGLGERLHACVRPESTVVYGRDGSRYVALVVEGRAVPSELPADGPVIATLRAHGGPVCLEGELAGPGTRSRDPFVRAALETLNAAVALPVAGAEGAPLAVVCVGAKRSGDLYTSSEVHLLRAVADRAALELHRFDEQEFRAQSRATHEALRRYVPGAVAESIERGDPLEAGEREVTVFFVDIRGYTALSAGSRAQEIFSTVNRYTRAVSERVQEEGGTVVEFNGDGMMAVFGAPRGLPAKEQAAARAARRVVEEVAALRHGEQPISVGVGVATGPAFVGSIQAADRMIWSAIGNTTNLAARLQSLTRELDADVILDAATHAALGAEGAGFHLHADVRIRGRSERCDVYLLTR